MDEFALIERYFAQRVGARADVRVGIGDDAAVTSFASGYELVVATDTLNEGTHFPAGTPARSLGHRCLAVNLSDLAAMGAEPLWCTLALSLPTGRADWVDAFSTGFVTLANAHGVALIGGDIVRGPLSMTATVHGRVAPGAAILRTGARAGDSIYVTGEVGMAAAGLAVLSGDAPVPRGSALVESFLYPVPRVSEGRALIGIASAMIDLSDGLHADLSRLLRASGVGAHLDADRIQLAAEPVERFGRERALEFALTGGDDYELCFTVPADRDAELRRAAAGWECGITRIGTVRARTEVIWHEGGQPRPVEDTSFRHFEDDGG